MHRIPSDPMSAPSLRWGIIGAGFIGTKFVEAVTRYTRSEVLAVASRDRARGELFARANGVPESVVGYDALLHDDRIDAVYVATPPGLHREHALMAVAAGKPVLVEKPFAANVAAGTAIADAATAAGIPVMEAMWSRFLPHMAALRAAIAAGEIGDVVHVHADFGQHFAFDPGYRMYDRSLAGGALLDMGVYPVSFIHDLLGTPSTVLSVATLAETAVDDHVSLAMQHAAGAQSTVFVTSRGLSGLTATVLGTEGRVDFGGPFHRPTSITISRRDGTTRAFDAVVQNGFQYEVAEFVRIVAEGRTQSEVLPLRETLDVLSTIDRARGQIGVRYPGEEER